MPRDEIIDYLLLGSLTRDLLPDGGSLLGGTGAFSATMARALGVRVGLVAAAAEDLDLSPLRGIALRRQPSACSTSFENRYVASGRTQILHQRADDLDADSVPSAWLQAPLVHLGPVAQDMDPTLIDAFPRALVGVTPQGWMRGWDDQGRVRRVPWTSASQVLARADATVLSIEDVEGDWDQLRRWAELARLLVVTRADHGARVFWRGERRDFEAPAVQVADPTGAGDRFAAAFFLQLQRTGCPWSAARYAVRLASASLTRPGLGGLPSAEEIAAADAD